MKADSQLPALACWEWFSPPPNCVPRQPNAKKVLTRWRNACRLLPLARCVDTVIFFLFLHMMEKPPILTTWYYPPRSLNLSVSKNSGAWFSSPLQLFFFLLFQMCRMVQCSVGVSFLLVCIAKVWLTALSAALSCFCDEKTLQCWLRDNLPRSLTVFLPSLLFLFLGCPHFLLSSLLPDKAWQCVTLHCTGTWKVWCKALSRWPALLLHVMRNPPMLTTW